MGGQLLTGDDKKAIEEAITKAEAATSGEIVFAVTDASDHYHHATLSGALVGMSLITLAYLISPAPHTVDLVLWVELVSFAILHAVIPYIPMRRWFIPSREMNARTQEAAFVEFYSSDLYKTQGANGVLIFLSLLERRVVVLGDRGIHEKLGNEHWDDVRDKIIRGIRAGKAREGICEAVDACGAALGKYFPHRPDDINELPDQVIDRRIKQ
jgi:putative membrane protein